MTAQAIDTDRRPTSGHAQSDGARLLRAVAALVLVAAPLLWSAGMFTSPEAASMSDADYVGSLARDPFLTAVSAVLLHYGNLFIGLGILAAPGLVRGRRGARLTAVGSLMVALGFTNISGLLLSDWWNAAVGAALPGEQAAEVFAAFKGGELLWAWTATEVLCLVGPVLVLVGLARAGVVGWYSLGLFVAGFLSLALVPPTMFWMAGVGTLVGFSPFAVVGLRLLQRLRLDG